MNLTLRNLLVAALMMLVGVLLVTNFIRNERRDLSRGKQEVQVFVAAKDIPAGTPAKELEDGGFLETRDVLREDQAPGAIGRISSVRDLVSNETVYKGETLTMNAFDRTTGLKPTAQIKGNERLVSIAINPAMTSAARFEPATTSTSTQHPHARRERPADPARSRGPRHRGDRDARQPPAGE